MYRLNLFIFRSSCRVDVYTVIYHCYVIYNTALFLIHQLFFCFNYFFYYFFINFTKIYIFFHLSTSRPINIHVLTVLDRLKQGTDEKSFINHMKCITCRRWKSYFTFWDRDPFFNGREDKFSDMRTPGSFYL